MIELKRGQDTMPDGSTAAYSSRRIEKGTTIPVLFEGKEGTAIVVRCHSMFNGQRFVLVLDVDWSSFDRTTDGE